MRSSLGARLKNVRKVDNHADSFADKVEIRQRVLDAVGGRVFDGFAGSGHMWSAVWRNADGYEGCDEKYYPDARLMFCADVHRVLRNIDLQRFSIFDFDAYGSPWQACVILAARRRVAPGARIGLVLTEGSGLGLKFGSMAGALTALAKVRKQPGVGRHGKEIAARAIAALARRMNCRIESTWRAERPQGSAMLYFGVVLVGL